ncbi:MAG TPA: SRPBCC domain-containing protein [Chitinophagaceae bacterium]|nr:SRPBCC domain-containing protein [Chitinophagaceae bacterium]
MPDIRHLVFFKTTPEKIYQAITTQQGIASWWSRDNNAKPEKGSIYRISFGGDYYKEIKVLELGAGKKVVWEILHADPEWLNTKVSFDISSGKNSTVLRFSHSGWKEYTDLFAQCSYHWAIYLGNLKAFTEKDQSFALSEFF